ncbi:hypothetical protein [Aeromonas bivalvium]|uniref:hypothetical protein n=1 Tax=Aeromonas bivalvium TaxID=440079 RepID=UPI000DD04118|nr:hypothetical protein [Aeromonas bivalvium]
MENANMPAMPIVNSNGVAALYGINQMAADGLSKREMIAMHIMCGIASDHARFTPEHGAEHAVLYADALLAELEKGGAS